MFLSASVGFCALTAIVRLFRGEKLIGNYFVDMWRVAVYILSARGADHRCHLHA
jgi:potassium-transporting ATPase potassium-binding subunit